MHFTVGSDRFLFFFFFFFFLTFNVVSEISHAISTDFLVNLLATERHYNRFRDMTHYIKRAKRAVYATFSKFFIKQTSTCSFSQFQNVNLF